MKSNSLILDGLILAREGAILSRPISLSLTATEMLLVRGHNGSGKSTFLKTLAGLIQPAGGSMSIHGQWPAARPPLYIGHKRGLTPSMSVYDNVVFWARASGHPELTSTAMHYFDLSDIADARLETLSAGWQQRVVLTRLITMHSSVWLLDEPTANLDVAGTALLQSLMQSRLEQNGIIVMTTHAQIDGDRIKTLNLSELSNKAEVHAA